MIFDQLVNLDNKEIDLKFLSDFSKNIILKKSCVIFNSSVRTEWP